MSANTQPQLSLQEKPLPTSPEKKSLTDIEQQNFLDRCQSKNIISWKIVIVNVGNKYDLPTLVK